MKQKDQILTQAQMETQHKQSKSPKTSTQELQKLRCSVKNYDWGITGCDSKVARLFAANSGLQIDPKKPYAEFWMGTHESGPSFLVYESNGVSKGSESNGVLKGSESVTLKSWIQRNPYVVLGDKVAQNWDCDLPFLFKVLSVGKALSIQAHPGKELAKVLHKLLPDVYKDANHKPEMALAVTQFEALCGFISLEELKDVIDNVPEIVELVGLAEAKQVLRLSVQDGEQKVKSVLQSIFTHLMSASKDIVTEAVSKLKARLLLESQVRRLTDKERLALLLEKQFPGDVGVISSFFFNYVKLKPGEALYVGPNEPHAYLSGECVECMATSDNVVRAGLTPKHRDVKSLCSMLTYKQGYPEILCGVSLNAYVKKYVPPFNEFEVDSCTLPQDASVVFPAVPGPSIFIVTLGEATLHTGSNVKYMVAEGDVLFVPAETEVTVLTMSNLQLYRAGINSKFFFQP